MIKIGGNRIESAEIEQASKRILNLSWAAAKGFVTPERSYVVLYYTDECKLNAQESREALAKSLPEYMLPSYFIHLDSIPLLPTGKLDKKNLPIPDINCYRTEYAAPETALEEKLLAAFENVLGLTHLSVNDDFYDLGGDSLRSIQLINMVQDPALNVPLLYRNRSVRALACAMTEDQDSGMASLEERDRKAREHDQRLCPCSTVCWISSSTTPSPPFPISRLSDGCQKSRSIRRSCCAHLKSWCGTSLCCSR